MLLFTSGNKVIINYSTGEKLGTLKMCDLRIDETNGKILALLVPKSKLSSFFSNEGEYTEVAWEKIKKIGIDTIIVEL